MERAVTGGVGFGWEVGFGVSNVSNGGSFGDETRMRLYQGVVATLQG